jgi:phosphohistidine swiveling domain-containing protein
MGKQLFVDTDKYYRGEGDPPVVDAFNSALKDLVRRKWEQSGATWDEFVFGKAYEFITAADIDAIDKQLLATGYRYTVSAMISGRERPEAYKAIAGAAPGTRISFEHAEAKVLPADADGREQRGQGDNVVRYPQNTIGIARYYRSSDQVLHSLNEGVPPETIAIIDDSGGTLTAPILEQFKGVICAGGTVRSHLGILTREYGIPCVMNSKISGIFDGDRVEIESTGLAKTAEAYARNQEMSVRVWKLQPKG